MNKDEIIKAIATECLLKAGKAYIETMDEFSQWLVDNEWELNYTTGKWVSLDNLYFHSMSELYQMFLKSKEA
tara:strand:- start:21 stop:236 length:216 start_codon:yes stop_codon:yes gene_type:complete